MKKEELDLSRGQLCNRSHGKITIKRLGSYLEGKSVPKLEDIPTLIDIFEITDFHSFITKELKNTG